MKKTLRPYQKDIVDRAINCKGNILIQAPTGSGKTFIAEKIIAHHRSKQLQCLFLAPKLNLLHQTTNAFKNLNPQVIHSSNKSGYDKSRFAFVSTIQTMSRRIELLEEIDFDYIVLDEMHYGAKGKMQEVIKKAHAGKIIGLSATPYDADGKLLTEDFDTVIDDYDTQYMVDNNYLVNINAYEAFTPNLDGVKIKRNEWDMQELDLRFNKPQMVNKVVSATKDIVKKRDKTIVFCINISHAEAMCEAYKSVGLKAEVTHSKLKKDIQQQRMNSFKNADTQVLVSVDQLTTGFDVPATDTIVLARPTQSQNLYKQIVGRALRLSPDTAKEEAILLDCGGVISRLGMPLDPIVERVVKKIERKPYCCKNCQSIKPRIFSMKDDHQKIVTICPDCDDEIEFIPKFIYMCDSCNRYYDFKNDKEFFSFENGDMNLDCSCGSVTHLGSLSDDEIAFIDLEAKAKKELNLLRAQAFESSPEILEELSQIDDVDILKEVAQNPNTSKKTLINLSKNSFEVFHPRFFFEHSEFDEYDRLDIMKNKDDEKSKRLSDTLTYLAFSKAHRNEDLDTVQWLIDNGADVNAKEDQYGTSVLMSSDFAGVVNIDFVRLLIDNGADVNATNNDGKTVFIKAAENEENIHVIQLLIDAGANIDAKGYKGRTALMNAADRGRLEIAKLLVENGADINAKNDNGRTALMYAVQDVHKHINDDKINIVKLLIDNGADLDAKEDQYGNTALDYARRSGNYRAKPVIQMIENALKNDGKR